MKPLMLIPPAQAEALFDAFAGAAFEGSTPQDRFAPLPWLDEDAPEDLLFQRSARPPREADGTVLTVPAAPGRRAA